MKHLKLIFTVILVTLNLTFIYSQTKERKTENVIVITLDGFRWEDLFGGTDMEILKDKNAVKEEDEIKDMFVASTPEESRKKLLPFFWTEIASKGQIYGNRKYDNLMNVANPYFFSYPGYNEIFTGYPDKGVNDNSKKPNPNINVLEFINKQDGFKGKVAAFASWDVFPAILNRDRSKFLVNAGTEEIVIPGQKLSPEMQLLNTMQDNDAHFLGLSIREDILTFNIGFEYLKEYHPRVLFMGFDGTDDYAHQGLYSSYLKQVHASDQSVKELWDYLQSDPQYRDKTTLIITCDHGRGNNPSGSWRDHGTDIPESSQTWLAVIGPDTPPLGEVKSKEQIYTKQIAPTIAALLGLKFVTEHGEALPLTSVFK